MPRKPETDFTYCYSKRHATKHKNFFFPYSPVLEGILNLHHDAFAYLVAIIILITYLLIRTLAPVILAKVLKITMKAQIIRAFYIPALTATAGKGLASESASSK